MRISHRHRFVFFSNPKTGSESVRALLDPYSDIQGVPLWKADAANPFYSHIRPCEVRDLFLQRGWPYDEYYTFTFVRNPWSRLVSLYQMIHASRGGRFERVMRATRDLLQSRTTHPSIPGFRAWLRTVRADGEGGGGPPDQRWQRYGTYTLRAYACGESGNLLVRRIVRLEDIDRDLPVVLSEIGLPAELGQRIPRVNTRRHRPYSDFYDASSRDLVARLYAEDIERFGYSFGGSA